VSEIGKIAATLEDLVREIQRQNELTDQILGYWRRREEKELASEVAAHQLAKARIDAMLADLRAARAEIGE
jgi:hypothetical protein